MFILALRDCYVDFLLQRSLVKAKDLFNASAILIVGFPLFLKADDPFRDRLCLAIWLLRN